MAFSIGDWVIYRETDVFGKDIKGKIIDITHNITHLFTYLVELDTGQYIQFSSENLKWRKVEEPVLIA